LTGSVHISTQNGGAAVSGASTGAQLYAIYDGSESLNFTYQWKKDGGNVSGSDGTTMVYTPAEAGSYTVTVSANGYQSKTSAAVTVVVGLTWSTVNQNIFAGQNAIRSAAYGGSKWVVCTLENIAYSADGGVNWTLANGEFLNTTNTFISALSYGGASGQEKFVVVGRYYQPIIAYSDDGINWTPASNTGFSTGNSSISAVAYGNGRWVAAGSSSSYDEESQTNTNTPKMAYSDDGINWTAISSTGFMPVRGGSSSIIAVAYGGGRWVAVGGDYSQKSVYSDDGITWIADSHRFNANTWLYTVAYGGDKFIAAGYNRTMNEFIFYCVYPAAAE
jgi:hypothetical protein